MTDSKDERKPGEAPKPAKPVIPPFRGPGTPGASPLRPFDANARGTRPPFVPPTIPGRKPATPARPAAAAPLPVTPVIAPVVTPVESGFRSLVVPLQPVSADAEPFIDPAPFVGTREAGAEARSDVVEDNVRLPEGVAAPDLVVAEREAPTPEPDVAAAALEVAYRASASMNAVTEPGPAHPLARTLHDLASRIERRELEVRGYEDGMTPEVSLAVLLAELLKRTR